MNTYKSSAQLKGMAREQLFGHYGTALGALFFEFLFILFSLTLLSTITTPFLSKGNIMGMIAAYLPACAVFLLMGLFASGSAYLYLKLSCYEMVSVNDILYGFQICPGKAITLQLCSLLAVIACQLPSQIAEYLYKVSSPYSSLWMLSILLFILGYMVAVFISLMLSQSFYLLQDFPQYSAKELLQTSCRMMKGHKRRLLYLSVSFFPLYLLALFSFGLAILWILPYQKAVMANFYMDLICHSQNKGN